MINSTWRGMQAVVAGLMVVLTTTSCGLPGEGSPGKGFDLVEYFEKEAERLTQQHRQLQKTVTSNNKTETHTTVSPDWSRELQPFAECDINKAAWAGSFDADTSMPGNNTLRIIYTARERAVKISRLELEWKEGILVAVTAVRQTSNPYYQSETILHYVPDSGYSINGWRKVIFMDNDMVKISADFNSPKNP